jgi:hypothetical protein
MSLAPHQKLTHQLPPFFRPGMGPPNSLLRHELAGEKQITSRVLLHISLSRHTPSASLNQKSRKRSNFMDRITKQTSRQATASSWLSRGLVTLIAITGLIFGATNANASCGFAPAGAKAPVMPSVALGQFDSGPSDGWGPRSIVGLWHVTYTTSGGDPFNDTFDTWHADGTEFESAFLPPDSGNICVGVWKTERNGKVKLHHVGWMFKSGTTTASGSFTLDEINTVSRDGNCYTGSFTFQVYDMNGDPQGGPVTGTISATRITVN